MKNAPTQTNNSHPSYTKSRQKSYYEIARRPKQLPSKDDGSSGYVGLPREFDYLLRGEKLSGLLQTAIVYLIARFTYGQKTAPEWGKISLTQFARMAGRKVERKNIAIAIADLEKREIIEARDRTGCKPTTMKMYKLRPDRWEKAKPYEPPKPKAEEPENEANDEADDEATAAPAPSAVVQGGKCSRSVQVAVRPKSGPPVDIRMVYYSRCDFPLEFTPRAGANGRLTVTVSSPPKTGEEKAKDCSRARPQSFASHSPSVVANKQNSPLAVAANRIILEFWGKAPDTDFLHRIATAAGSATPETFERLVRIKLRGRNGGRHVPGILLSIAQDAARTQLAIDVNSSESTKKPYPPGYAEALGRLAKDDNLSTEALEREITRIRTEFGIPDDGGAR